MDIMKILDEMEELVDSGSRIPLVGKVLIDAEGLLSVWTASELRYLRKSNRLSS